MMIPKQSSPVLRGRGMASVPDEGLLPSRPWWQPTATWCSSRCAARATACGAACAVLSGPLLIACEAGCAADYTSCREHC